jgi:hypothetical protein
MIVAVGVLIAAATQAVASGVVRLLRRLALLFCDAGVDCAVELVFLQLTLDIAA